MKTINRKHIGSIAILSIFFAAMLVILSSCGDAGSITSATNNNNGTGSSSMSVSVKSDDAVLDNPGAIVITEAKALVTEMEFEKEGTAENQEIHMAPFVIHFDMNGSITNAITSTIPAGNFTKVKFQIHKPEDTETIPDSDFREGSSGNQRYSFIVKGTYNGTAFVYKSRKSANLVINLRKKLALQLSGKNITVLFSKLGWFKNGSVDLDPNSSQNENSIDDNLRNSFHDAFEDNNHDGHPDDN